MAVENWNQTELINFSAWHEPECDFINDRDESNVPMSKSKAFLQLRSRHSNLK